MTDLKNGDLVYVSDISEEDALASKIKWTYVGEYRGAFFVTGLRSTMLTKWGHVVEIPKESVCSNLELYIKRTVFVDRLAASVNDLQKLGAYKYGLGLTNASRLTVNGSGYDPATKTYIKKPVSVTAYQWFGITPHQKDQVRDVDYYRKPEKDGLAPCPHCIHIRGNHGWIDTLEGGHKVCPGDFIITGVKGEKYPCKPDIFRQTYFTQDDYAKSVG